MVDATECDYCLGLGNHFGFFRRGDNLGLDILAPSFSGRL